MSRSERFALSIPAAPEHVGTARLFLGAVARQLGVEEESVDELKVVVSEACAVGVRADQPVTVAATWEDGVLRTEISDGGAILAADQDHASDDVSDPDTDELIASLALDLIHALVPEAVIERAPGGSRIRFDVSA